jgi:hypothetical protein
MYSYRISDKKDANYGPSAMCNDDAFISNLLPESSTSVYYLVVDGFARHPPEIGLGGKAVPASCGFSARAPPSRSRCSPPPLGWFPAGWWRWSMIWKHED